MLRRAIEDFESSTIDQILNIALENLVQKDGELFTEDVNERTICARLAFYLQEQLQDFHVDCEYNRHHKDPKHIKRLRDPILRKLAGRRPEIDDSDSVTVFPDIIIHRRGSDENLLVIETKKTTSRVSSEFDTQKLKAFQSELGFRFARFILFHTDSGKQPEAEIKPLDLNNSSMVNGKRPKIHPLPFHR